MDQNEADPPCDDAVPEFTMDEATSGGFNAWFLSLPQARKICSERLHMSPCRF
jgi:hypothetical protein